MHPPIPPTHPPQEKSDVLQHEPTNGEEGGRSSGEEDGEAESLGYGVGGEAGDGGGELFGGVRFPCDVAEEEGIVFTAVLLVSNSLSEQATVMAIVRKEEKRDM